MRHSWFIIALLLCSSVASASTVSIPFYGEIFQLEYDAAMVARQQPVAGNDQTRQRYMVGFFDEIDQKPFYKLLGSLDQVRRDYQLNDYLYYDLIRKAIHKIYASEPTQNRRLAMWHLLSRAGFDARITYLGSNVFVNVYSEDHLFEVPMIMDGGRKLINLSSFEDPERSYARLYILDFVPNKTGRSFSFDLKNNLPRLTPRYVTRRVRFGFQNTTYQVDVELDQTLMDVMSNYPYLSEDKYLEIPLSPQLHQTLIPKLRKLMGNRSEREKLELLASFTRSGFRYKTDEEFFGRSRPMIADELFHYQYSDCEDRSALFYWLVRETMGLPAVVIAYPDHVTVGVASNEVLGDSIRMDGRNYYICDPTGPSNSSRVGQFPRGYASRDFDVLTKYK